MSLLPKSIHRCRRYLTKFNSGRDIPAATSIALTGASLGAGLSCSFQADVTAPSAGAKANNIPAADLNNDQGRDAAADANDTLTVLAAADVTQIHYRWRNDDGPEVVFDIGDGADGALTPAATFNLNTNLSGARVFADGIAYRIDAATATGTSVDRVSVSGTLSNGIAAGDEVLLINLQGVAGDTVDVGNHEFLEVLSVTATTITFASSISNSYDRTVPGNLCLSTRSGPLCSSNLAHPKLLINKDEL